MSKIMSKSMPVLGASAPPAAAAKAQSNGGDVLFSKLFGGAAGEMLHGDGGIDAAAMAAALSAASGDQDEGDSQPQDELLAMIAALQAGRGFGPSIKRNACAFRTIRSESAGAKGYFPRRGAGKRRISRRAF